MPMTKRTIFFADGGTDSKARPMPMWSYLGTRGRKGWEGAAAETERRLLDQVGQVPEFSRPTNGAEGSRTPDL